MFKEDFGPIKPDMSCCYFLHTDIPTFLLKLKKSVKEMIYEKKKKSLTI